MVCRVKGGKPLNALEPVKIPDVVQPAGAAFRVGGDAHQDDEYVERGGDNHCGHEDAEHVPAIELVLRSRVIDALKTDERPRREVRDTEDLPERTLVRQERRGHGHARIAMLRHNDQEARRDTYGEHQHQRHHRPSRHLLAPDAHQRDKADGQNRDQDLPEVHLVAKYRVEVTDLEYAPEEVAREERDARGVGPEDGDVHQEHEPRHEKRTVVTEDVLDVVIEAASAGVSDGQEAVVTAHHEHHGGADEEAKDGARRPRLGKIGAARDDERTPPDSRAYG